MEDGGGQTLVIWLFTATSIISFRIFPGSPTLWVTWRCVRRFFLHSPSGGIILYFFFQKGVALTLTVRPSYLRSRGLKCFLRITLILDHCSDISQMSTNNDSDKERKPIPIRSGITIKQQPGSGHSLCKYLFLSL